MKYIPIVFIIVLSLISCTLKPKDSSKVNHQKKVINNSLKDNHKIKLLLIEVLKIEEVESLNELSQRNNGRPFYLAIQDSLGITEKLNIQKNDVQFIDYTYDKRENLKNVLYFNLFDVSKDSANVHFFYREANFGGRLTFYYFNDKWNLNSSEFFLR